MTSDAAHTAANDNSARGATRTPSVEQNESAYQQIGSSMTTVNEASDSQQADFGRSATAPSAAELGQAIAARTAAELPSLAAKISASELADVMTQAITQTDILPGPFAATDRGTEWMARYGCPAWCVMDHAGADGEPGWHQGHRAEAVAPTSFCDAFPRDDSAVVLAARVTQVNQDPEIFGIETRIWVDVDTETLELDVAQTDVFIARLEVFLPQLRALRSQLAEASKGDIPENTDAKAAWLAKPAAPVNQ
jgi:hypothetical protein